MSGDTIYSSAYGNDGFRRFLIRVFIPIFALVLFAAVIYFPFALYASFAPTDDGDEGVFIIVGDF
ncbi:MAG: hypothetical protein VCD00_02310 [Candidatus Hydrogenedentota bacterium]